MALFHLQIGSCEMSDGASSLCSLCLATGMAFAIRVKRGIQCFDCTAVYWSIGNFLVLMGLHPFRPPNNIRVPTIVSFEQPVPPAVATCPARCEHKGEDKVTSVRNDFAKHLCAHRSEVD
jgi:hypothetical protein